MLKRITTLTLAILCFGFWANAQTQQIDLPVTFDDPAVNYALTDFGGNISSIVMDPAGGANMVGKAVKNGPGTQLWAGTTMGTDTTGFANPIPFTANATSMTVRVYAPAAGIPIRLKVEERANNTISVETEDTTTVANAWETLTFDFSNEAPGTAALNINNTYDLASIFFNFGKDGTQVGADSVYYWDDVEFVPDTTTSVVNVSPYCQTQVFHLGNPAEIASSILLTVANQDPNTLFVEIESADADTVDLLLVTGGSGATISAENTTVPGKISRTLTWSTAPDSVTMNILWSKVSFAGNWQLSPTDITLAVADTCPPQVPQLDQIDLPVTFDDPDVDYTLTDFAGNYSDLVPDPAGGSNTVARSIKSIGSQTFSGTTMGTPSTGFANPIPFTANETKLKVRVYAPATGLPIRFKVEDNSDPTKSVETEVNTTVANAWETLEFDFSNEVSGTAPIDLANTYDRATLFFNFGVDGAGAGADTVFYWDDVEFVPDTSNLMQIDLPVTFEDTAVDYTLTDFAGNYSQLVADPSGATNTVAQSIKSIGSQTFAGTTMGTNGFGFANPIPFEAGKTKMKVRVYAPATGIPVRLKVEDAADPTKSVETEVNTTMANAWETLEFDFSNEAPGTSPLDLNNTYDKATIFFYFGTDGVGIGADSVYYWDDVEFDTTGGPVLNPVDLPITFEDTTVDYNLEDFGGNVSMIVTDPTDPGNTVVRSIKTPGAELWAGTTAGGNGLANPIPFVMGETKMNVRVWSPVAGIPIRLKVEDAGDPTISVETEATTTVASDWETLEFDFSNEASGTAPINLANTYDKVSIFFNFGTPGSGLGADTTFYWDDVKFGAKTVGIEDLEEMGLAFFPNPAQELVTIRSESMLNEIKLFDLRGVELIRTQPNQLEASLKLEELEPGMYLVQVRSGKTIGTFRLIKQ